MEFDKRATAVERFFAGVTEHTFHAQLGVTDTQMVDYLTGLLSRFTCSDVVYRVRNLTGRPLSEVAAMILEAEERIGEARREVHRHVGDFILFWAGLYPEALRKMKSQGSADALIDYTTQGRRSYQIASNIPADPKSNAPGPVLERLACEFDLCVYGLGEVRRELERRDDNNDGLCLFYSN